MPQQIITIRTALTNTSNSDNNIVKMNNKTNTHTTIQKYKNKYLNIYILL